MHKTVARMETLKKETKEEMNTACNIADDQNFYLPPSKDDL